MFHQTVLDQTVFRKFAARMAFALAAIIPALSFAGTPVNINQADASTIAKSLDGIGQSKAEAIVAWRDAHGPFKSPDELTQVKGIGNATLERNRASILLADAAAAPAPAPASSATKTSATPAKKARRSSKKAAVTTATAPGQD
jgi:competence protein ComEA